MVTALLCIAAGQRGLAGPDDTSLVNSAVATYADSNGRTYTVDSNDVVATVAPVSSLLVSPKDPAADPQTDNVPVGQNAVRTFVITNTGNTADTYSVPHLAAGALKILSAIFISTDGTTRSALGRGTSSSVPPSTSIKLVVTLSTANLTPGQIVPVDATVQSGLDATRTNSGRTWLIGMTPPQLGGPNGAAQISMTVDKQASIQSSPGIAVTFDIVAQNGGGSPAQNVIVVDDVPAGLVIDASSVRFNGQPAGSGATGLGQRLTMHLGNIAPGTQMDISFVAAVSTSDAAGGTFVNVASVSSDGMPAQQTTPASVLCGSANIVFDGFGGANHPIANVTLMLLDANQQPVKLAVQNPMVTGSGGTFVMPIPASAIGASGSRFYLSILAHGYLNRKLQLDIVPDTQKLLYDVKISSLDSQPLAAAGTFVLTSNPVLLSNVVGLFGNIPLFLAQAIGVTKSADRQAAQPGDRVVYTVTYATTSGGTVRAASLLDTLPAGLIYGTGSGRLDGVAVEPAIAGRTLTWPVPDLAPGTQHTLTYATVVVPGVAPQTILSNVVMVSGILAGTLAKVSGTASATISVAGGAFADRRVIVGRAFVDTCGTGHFCSADRGVAGIRIFLEDGSSCVTDGDGRFSFPAVRPGLHALRIDTSTLPEGISAKRFARINSAYSTQRIMHGIFDDITMEDVEFALIGLSK